MGVGIASLMAFSAGSFVDVAQPGVDFTFINSADTPGFISLNCQTVKSFAFCPLCSVPALIDL